MPGKSQTVELQLLGQLPPTLRAELLHSYREVVRNYRERRWEPSELNGGKLCEVIYSILKGHISGTLPDKSTKPRNMLIACRALENEPVTFPRSIRIEIPRMLLALYEIRNNRGVGHVGGDVNPNFMDATCVVEMSKWLLAELVRIFHNVSTQEATVAVTALVERTVPIIWKVGEKLRVLDTSLSMRDKALLLLYHTHVPISEAKLCSWVEHSNPAIFRRDVLRRAHDAKLVEYDPDNATVEISPLGIQLVESRLLN